MADPQKVVLQNVTVDGTRKTIVPATLADAVVTQNINNTGRSTVDALLKDIFGVQATLTKNISTCSTDLSTFKTNTQNALDAIVERVTFSETSLTSLSATVTKNHTTLNSSVSGLQTTVDTLTKQQTSFQSTLTTVSGKLENISSFKYGDNSPTHAGSEGEVYFEY